MLSPGMRFGASASSVPGTRVFRNLQNVSPLRDATRRADVLAEPAPKAVVLPLEHHVDCPLQDIAVVVAFVLRLGVLLHRLRGGARRRVCGVEVVAELRDLLAQLCHADWRRRGRGGCCARRPQGDREARTLCRGLRLGRLLGGVGEVDCLYTVLRC